MKKLLNFLKTENHKKRKAAPLKKEELEKKVVAGAKKAAKEYRRVFERLAEHDRT